MLKVCAQCKYLKTFDEFHKRAASPDGLHRFCKTCVNTYTSEWRANNREAARKAVTRYRNRNSEAMNAKARGYRYENADKAKLAVRRWQKNNTAVMNANKAKRRAAKLKATPVWADQSKITEYYFAADFLGMVTGIWHHVDHIVPLQSDIVCGLHWEENLQVLTAIDNLRKSNQRWPDMPES